MEAGNGGTTGSSRWNPTKEQINMLEGLYKEGVRTPSADQIQQITSRLRAYGQIEGKNVFYWFQNHKARQRQKQKQESMSYFNRLLHRTTRLLYPPPCINVGCGAYYLQQGDGGTHPQSHQVLVPGGCKKKPGCGHRSDKTTKLYGYGGIGPFSHHDGLRTKSPEITNSFPGDDSNQKTLPLFPLQPTGVSRETATASMEDSDSTPISTSSETTNLQQPFFDFFSASNDSCDSGTVTEWRS